MLRCRECGKENVAEARFCPNCGTALATRPSAARKAVTVVFTDVAGFTNLSEHLDPERVATVMTRYFEEMKAVVERHGGKVEKFIGDAVMAVFGVPQLHEDDALRAVRAAAEMREALGALNDRLARDSGVTIQVRTGINTGEVAVGPGRGGGGFVLGDPVNVAARLQQAAAPQEILVGEDTYRLIEGAIEVDQLEPLSLKGKDSPVRAFRLLRVTPGRPARAGRLTSALVGRDREKALLHEAFQLSGSERACRLVTVVAPAGIGKTRLVAEFVKEIEDEATILQGDCLSYGDAITYWPVTRVVAQAAGIGDGDPPEVARAKIASLVEGENESELIVQRGAQVFGLGPSSTASDEVFWAVRKLLETLARRRPVVVVFEDAHWAEPTFLDLVEHIVDWSRGAPILVLCLARPELLAERAGWGEGRANATSIALEPLSADQSGQLIEQLLGTEHLSERASGRISDAAQGNPLYLKELLSMLIDEGLLRRAGDRWVPDTDLQEITVPPTIQALLAARLDRLAPDARWAIEAASVMGTAFDPVALVALVRQEAAQIGSALDALVADELLQPEPSSLGGQGLRFHHALLREAAYTGTSKERRAELHERHAAWLERSAGERVAEYEEILGHHLESAYRYRQELRPLDEHGQDLARRGGERLAGAGCSAFARGDVLAAANLLSRAVDLLPAEHELRVSVLPNLSEALMSTGRLEQADAVLNEAFGVARASGDTRLQAHVMLVRSVQRVFTEPEGVAEAGRQEVTRAIPLFEAAQDGLGLARAWRLLSIVHASLARFSDAEEAMDQAVTHAARAGDRRVELEALSWLPLFVWAGPTPPEPGIRRCEEIQARADDDPQVEASALSARAGFEAMRGRFAEARQAASLSRAILEDLGLRVSIAGPWSQLRGWVELFAGDFAAAEKELRLGYQALEQMGEVGWLSTVAGLLAHTIYAQGRYDEAESMATSGEGFSGPDDLYSQVLFRSARAKVRARQHRADEAEQLAREAVSLSERTDFLQLQGEALMDLAEVLHLGGRPAQAVPHVEYALRLYRLKGCIISEERARSRLQRLTQASPFP